MSPARPEGSANATGSLACRRPFVRSIRWRGIRRVTRGRVAGGEGFVERCINPAFMAGVDASDTFLRRQLALRFEPVLFLGPVGPSPRMPQLIGKLRNRFW
jgi:hypothetical protein